MRLHEKGSRGEWPWLEESLMTLVVAVNSPPYSTFLVFYKNFLKNLKARFCCEGKREVPI